MPVTMRDVAARAKVSPVVVSRVLHNKATAIRVSEATADRVRQAADELGYRCNIWARNFRAQQTMTIGMLHGIGFDRPVFNRGSRYFSALMDGIVEGAFKNGYSVTLCPRLLSQTPEDAMSDGRFDGFVWYSNVVSEANTKMLLGCSVPLVVIHSKTEEIENKFPTIICDNEQGISLAVDHLVGLSHKRIAFATEYTWETAESAARLRAFRAHMRSLGLPISEADILDFSDRRDLDTYLAVGPAHTGIVANNDGVASEVILRAPNHGVRIPDHLSIVGFDSTSYCDELRPSLTSVSQPLFQMGERAIDQLVHVMNGRSPSPLEVLFPCGLDVRGSTQTIYS